MFTPRYFTAEETFHLYRQALRQADMRRFDAHLNAILHPDNAPGLQAHEEAMARLEADFSAFITAFTSVPPTPDPTPSDTTPDATPTTEPHEESPACLPSPLSPASTGESDLLTP